MQFPHIGVDKGFPIVILKFYTHKYIDGNMYVA